MLDVGTIPSPDSITSGISNLIFENLYKKRKPLTVVRPGNQTRKFTHIYDTVNVCYEAWKKNKSKHY